MTTDAAPNVNLAAGKPTSESGHVQSYGSGNVVDGNANTYWESPNNAFPQWVQVDLGAATAVSRVVAKLPPASAWQTRTQTIEVQGSTNRHDVLDRSRRRRAGCSTLATGNTVTITFTALVAAVRAAAVHREHRLAGGSALGVRGVLFAS